ncbi:MAG: NDP-sugar synthase [Vicinamibacterales bacterium]
MTPAAPWPALLLAAGYGTRLRPLSDVRAKAALPVAGRPLIVHLLERLRDAGLSDIVINLHHRAETVAAAAGDGAAWGLRVRYSWEPRPLGSGGGPARALPLLAADRFFIVNGDTVSGVDYAALARAHEESGAEATLAAAPADLARYNALLADASGSVVGVAARGTRPEDLPQGAQPWHFVGVQAVNASAFAGVDPSSESDTIRGIYPALLATRPGAVRIARATSGFADIGTPGDYYDTTRRLCAEAGRPLDRGAGCIVADSAVVEETILWDRVRVGAGARLLRCIVADDVEVPPGARHERMILTASGPVPF